MARTALASQTATEAGIVPTFSAANAAGHSISPGAMLYVKNGGGGSINVTIQTPATFRGKDVAETVVAVGAGVDKIIGGLDRASYVRTSAPDKGTIYVDFSGVTSVTVAALTQ